MEREGFAAFFFRLKDHRRNFCPWSFSFLCGTEALNRYNSDHSILAESTSWNLNFGI